MIRRCNYTLNKYRIIYCSFIINILKSRRVIDIIRKMHMSKIGDEKTWMEIENKIINNIPLITEESKYFAQMTRIYKNPSIPHRKIFHSKLPEDNMYIPCNTCKESAKYYCHMNDLYFCMKHIVGHDENE